MVRGNSVKGGSCHGKENRREDFHLAEYGGRESAA